MLSFTIQVILLLAGAFLLGCAAGCWSGRWYAARTDAGGKKPRTRTGAAAGKKKRAAAARPRRKK